MQMCYDLKPTQDVEKSRAKKKRFWRHYGKVYAPKRKTIGACFPDLFARVFSDLWLTKLRSMLHGSQGFTEC
ncbi:hypothetical protein C7382_103127 [Porphyromonas loveana]|uniref:Uncharacterized protein n=1 Tax=Porphyromonas loveana TaxID=1884669 RepID=A0A2U1FMZ8_9PORP|nr:hypothetical protein C7382_103127 [Porphyromonas loveana]